MKTLKKGAFWAGKSAEQRTEQIRLRGNASEARSGNQFRAWEPGFTKKEIVLAIKN